MGGTTRQCLPILPWSIGKHCRIVSQVSLRISFCKSYRMHGLMP